MRVIFFDGGGGHERWFRILARFLVRNGHAVTRRYGAKKRLRPVNPSGHDRAVIWNGCQHVDKQFVKRCRKARVPVCYMEVGFFSQKTHAMVSRRGSVGGDLFSGEEIPDLPLGGESFLEEKFAEYSGGKRYEGDGTIVAGFLQLPNDMSIRVHSRFTGMQQFINEAERLFPDDRVVFKVHPKMRKVRLQAKCPFYRGATIWPHVLRAKRCVAVNSTALYEAAFAGVPVTALGNCPLASHPDKHREIVHEILMRQLPIHSKDIGDQVCRSIGSFFDAKA